MFIHRYSVYLFICYFIFIYSRLLFIHFHSCFLFFMCLIALPTYATNDFVLPPSGTAGSMADYTYSSPYTQYSSAYPTYGYGTGGLLSK